MARLVFKQKRLKPAALAGVLVLHSGLASAANPSGSLDSVSTELGICPTTISSGTSRWA